MAEFQQRYSGFRESDAIYKPLGAMRGVESAIHRRSAGECGLRSGQVLLVGNADAIGGSGDAGSGGGVGGALMHAALHENRCGRGHGKRVRGRAEKRTVRKQKGKRRGTGSPESKRGGAADIINHKPV